MRKQARNNKRGQRGLTLIEAAMVLALSAVVVAGAVMYYQSAAENNKAQVALGQLGMIQSAVQTVTGMSANYNGLTTKDIVKSSNIPNSQKSGDDLISPWGKITVAGSATNYTVAMEHVPLGPCQVLAGQDLGSSLTELAVDKTKGQPGKAAAAACKTDTTLTWTFK
jgi:major structural subunit of bundle-forming pilus